MENLEKSEKFRKLEDEELESVTGGSYWHIRCPNPNCPNYTMKCRTCGQFCELCGAEMEFVSEGFWLPD